MKLAAGAGRYTSYDDSLVAQPPLKPNHPHHATNSPATLPTSYTFLTLNPTEPPGSVFVSVRC
jgi:hypothetical protein